MKVIIKKAEVEDAEKILSLQKEAFRNVADLYSHCTIPPMTENLETLLGEFKNKVVLKASIDGKIVGSIRAFKENGTCYLEKLMVRPSLQGQGIGTKLMQAIEGHFKGSVKRIQLSTVHKSTANIRLYEKLGYVTYKTEKVNNDVTFVYMEKCIA
ncbi:MAG: GNAT family N-acetyltransferase [Candidatus Omnitrophota bacterium]|jgi:ribosomal protein S18 acetylase RimI-like enzyme